MKKKMAWSLVMSCLCASLFVVVGCSKPEEKKVEAPAVSAPAGTPQVAAPMAQEEKTVLQEKAGEAASAVGVLGREVMDATGNKASELGQAGAEKARAMMDAVKEEAPEAYQKVVGQAKEMGASLMDSAKDKMATEEAVPAVGNADAQKNMVDEATGMLQEKAAAGGTAASQEAATEAQSSGSSMTEKAGEGMKSLPSFK